VKDAWEHTKLTLTSEKTLSWSIMRDGFKCSWADLLYFRWAHQIMVHHIVLRKS